MNWPTNCKLIKIILLFYLFFVVVFVVKCKPVQKLLIPPTQQRIGNDENVSERQEIGSISPLNVHPAPLVHPNIVKDHHLREAFEHFKQGTKLSTSSLSLGANKGHELNLDAMVDCLGCHPLEASENGRRSLRTSHAGLAGCLNVSSYSIKNILKHLCNSFSHLKTNQNHEQFMQNSQNDRRSRLHNYRNFRENVNYINEHH